MEMIVQVDSILQAVTVGLQGFDVAGDGFAVDLGLEDELYAGGDLAVGAALYLKDDK